MYKLVATLTICLSTVLGFCQSTPKYEAASILEVVPLRTSASESDSTQLYKITLQTSNTVYVVLFTSAAGPAIVNCAAGMQTTALIGDNSIKVNDLLGRSHEAPIVSRRSTAVARK